MVHSCACAMILSGHSGIFFRSKAVRPACAAPVRTGGGRRARAADRRTAAARAITAGVRTRAGNQQLQRLWRRQMHPARVLALECPLHCPWSAGLGSAAL